MIFWYGGDDIDFGVMFYIVFVSDSSLLVFFRFFGGLGFFSVDSRCLRLCSELSVVLLFVLMFILSVMWCGVLNRLLSIGNVLLGGVLNSSVGLLVCSMWLYSLVILSMGDMGCVMCCSLLSVLRC